MATIVDSYSEANYSSTGGSEFGQSFTGDGQILDSVKLYLEKNGSPTGNATAKIYAHSGTFGTSSVPTGSALATSDNFDVSTLTTSLALVTFTFSGANRITLTNATKYVVTFEYVSVAPNFVYDGKDTTSPTHAGNASYYSGGWNASSDEDVCFYVYGVPAGSPSASLSPSASISASPSESASASPSSSVSPIISSASGKVLVTKPGKSVFSTILDDFYLHSDYPLLKVHSFGTFTTLNDGTKTITHNLGYRPFVLVFSQFVDQSGGVAVLTDEYYQHDWNIDGATVTFFGYTKIYANTIDIVTGNTNVTTWAGGTDGIYFIFKDEL